VSKPILLFLVVAMVACLTGCGGSSSQGTTSIVRIENARFFPRNATLPVGNSLQWINTDSQPHRVVGGTLLPVSPGVEHDPISIRENNTFVPAVFEANFGDTLVWRNDRVGPFNLEILDDAGNVIVTQSLLQGQELSFSAFPSAGFYTYQQQGNVLFKGSLFLYGIPNPNGSFDSLTLNNGGTFVRTFPNAGVYPYYDLNERNPNKSFATGRVQVQ